jgi:hypothetical protein
MSAKPLYVQLIWEDTETGESQQPILAPPIAMGRELDQMPENLGEQAVSRLELANKQVSRFHCLITVVNHQLYVTDRSANGTFLNGQPLRPGNHPFSSKDTLRIGSYKIIASLVRDNDLDSTEINREHTHFQKGSSLPSNALVIWLVGGLVLVLMGIGAWFLVSTLLERSRPRVPEAPTPVSSVPLQRSPIS